ncbi:VOC family protein [Klebsiella oxytoca]
MISFEVNNVDESYQTFLAKGIKFINQPMDMPEWGMRVVHLYDPEENLIELFTPYSACYNRLIYTIKSAI